MQKTSISWCDYTSNPLRATNIESGKAGHFCEKVSEGCRNCYASEWNENRYGTGLAFIPRNRDKVRFWLNEAELLEWLKPKYAGAKIFPCDMTDLFAEWVPDHWIIDILAAMERSPATFIIVTKRAERMREMVTRYCRANLQHADGTFGFLPNVWLLVSVEKQKWADVRIPILLDTPAAVRGISYEPALGPVDLDDYLPLALLPDHEWRECVCDEIDPADKPCIVCDMRSGLNWVICGAESGPRRRPFDYDWARTVRDQCREAGVAFWMKQGPGRFSENYDGVPEDLHIREWPEVRA